MTMSHNINGQFGDTTLTKVFVGGLAWETPKEALRDHFDCYGQILEAVIICDKITSRSKGYGFVTFKDPEAAKKACEEATPIINGRRANCNLASLGARRPRSLSNASHQGGNGPPRSVSAQPVNHVQWYYPAGTPATAFHHQHRQAVPFYGYSPSYIAPDMTYNHKVGYMNGHFPASQVYSGQNTLMPMYPVYPYHQTQTMGLPAPIFHPSAATAAPIHVAAAPRIMSKPVSIAHPPPPPTGTSGSLKKGYYHYYYYY